MMSPSRQRRVWRFILVTLTHAYLAMAANAQEPPAAAPIRSLAFSHDGSKLAIGFGSKEIPGGVRLIEMREGGVVGETIGSIADEAGVWSIAFSPDGQSIAFADDGAQVRIAPARLGDMITQLDPDHRGPVAFSPDGKLLATGGSDKAIRLWDLAAGADRFALPASTDVARRLCFSADGSRLVAPCGEAGVELYDLGERSKRHTFKHGPAFMSTAAIAPDGTTVITGGSDLSTRIWDADSGQEIARLEMPCQRLVSYSSEAGAIAACSQSKEVHLYPIDFDRPSPELLTRVSQLIDELASDSYEAREATSEALAGLGFPAQSELKRFAAESPDPEVRIRARRARQAILTSKTILSDFETGVNVVQFSPNGKLLATGAADGTVAIWDPSTNQRVSRIEPAP